MRLGCYIWNLKPIVKAFWPNRRLQRTALGADKIGAILKAEFGPKAFPIYECAAAEAQHVGPEASSRSHLCVCAGGLNAVVVEAANRRSSRATVCRLARLATLSQTPSNAVSGHAIEGLRSNHAIGGNAFERHHRQRNRVPSRLARACEEGRRSSSQATHSGCCVWKVKPIVKAFWPNRRLQLTPLCGERDRGDFESRFRLECYLVLLMRRN